LYKNYRPRHGTDCFLGSVTDHGHVQMLFFEQCLNPDGAFCESIAKPICRNVGHGLEGETLIRA
jgi:hypothetical protein